MICYLDDDVDQDLLIRLGAKYAHQLVSPRSLNRSGDHDALHFLYAASQQMPIMTRNASDFEALHEFALGTGGHHSGVIIVYEEDDRRKNMRPPEIVAALSNLDSASVSLADQLIALNHYR